jgi:hypothetical protein
MSACDCGKPILGHAKRCPTCQRQARLATVARAVRKYTATHPVYKTQRAEHRQASHHKCGDAWVLVEAPAGCMFHVGATFTMTDIRSCKSWAEAGMIFKCGDKELKI